MTGGLLSRTRLFIAPSAARPPKASARRSARAAVAWFALATLVLSGATLVAADAFQMRDPEYGRRASALCLRVRENPDRPLVLVVGSSRVGAGVRPAAWEAVRGDGKPMLFNLGRAGAGPVLQLMMLRRALAEGVKPAVVLLEYWPPLLNHQQAPECGRIPAEQILARDMPTIRDYWQDGGEFERRAWRSCLNPIYNLRRTLMLQLDPTWMPWPSRTEMVWANLDAWGWLPGLDFPPEGCAERGKWLAKWEPIFRPQLRAFEVSGRAERALREAVAVAREHGAAVGFVYLPESGEFRGWYSRKADRAAKAHLDDLSRDLGVAAIDSREWLADGLVADGFHLSRRGAEEFTRRLGSAVIARFPEVRP